MGTVVGILRTIHDESVGARLKYTFDEMKEIILEFRPDVICGEIRPERWAMYQNDEDYGGELGPSEYRSMILPLCEMHEIEFVPIDWLDDDLCDLSYVRNYSNEFAQQAERELEAWYKRIFSVENVGPIPFNSREFDQIVFEQKEWLKSLDPAVFNIKWECRNQIMVERIRKAISKKEGKRILCTAGAEHNYFFYNSLRNGTGYELV